MANNKTYENTFNRNNVSKQKTHRKHIKINNITQQIKCINIYTKFRVIIIIIINYCFFVYVLTRQLGGQ